MSKRSRKAGLPPGSLVYIGDHAVRDVKIHIFDYNEHDFIEKDAAQLSDCFGYKDSGRVTWINVDGVHSKEIIEGLGNHYGIHPLIQEDIMTPDQRPKLDEQEGSVYVVMKMISTANKDHVGFEQISFIIGDKFVISFQEKPGDCFDVIRERIRQAKGRVRKMGADYLAYALIDTLIDDYYLVLEQYSDNVEKMENELLKEPSEKLLNTVFKLKSSITSVRNAIWPVRELISKLEKSESRLISKTTKPFIRDIYDHVVQIIDTVEIVRDRNSSLIDMYMSSMSNKMNEVMKVLTIIATIFIPLTFISGVYGMNFRHLPELEWKYGYFIILGVMALVAFGMLAYFKRKKWL